ncbi:MAG: DUF4160 domain-containing protein [Bacteroidota bacterium]
MPSISRFYGILIYLYYRDHPPPHLHAKYGGDEALFNMQNFEVIEGKLPKRAMRLVKEWMELHKEELIANWERVKEYQEPVQIKPLD